MSEEFASTKSIYEKLVRVLEPRPNTACSISNFGQEIMGQIPKQYQDPHIAQTVIHELGHHKFAINHGSEWECCFIYPERYQQACCICRANNLPEERAFVMIVLSLYAIPECYAFIFESAYGFCDHRYESMITRCFDPNLHREANHPITKEYELAFLLTLKLIGVEINSGLNLDEARMLGSKCGFEPTNSEELRLFYPMLDEDSKREVAKLALSKF
ncbi:MAG: hypothetical protein NZO16_01975 [Deltaproteobacteria bacterium]|nr:hypothetical protein [Deltaproteobacteria bacterium]